MTKSEFLKVYNSYPPNGWTKFVYKYFSKETLQKDTWLKKIFIGVLIGLFAFGFIVTAITNGEARRLIGLPTMTYGIILAILVIGCFIGAMMNKWRIKKIAKKLGITLAKYNEYVELYFG